MHRNGRSTWHAECMLQLDTAEFERLVVDELDLLPDDMVDGLENVIFVVEDRPENGTLDTLGLYDGVALTERDQYGFGEMPDRIILYREALLAACETLDELHDEVHITLVHEIGHFYGIDDDRLHELGWA
jgi:predicted Zn-dependent protease with MMP-like domain